MGFFYMLKRPLSCFFLTVIRTQILPMLHCQAQEQEHTPFQTKVHNILFLKPVVKTTIPYLQVVYMGLAMYSPAIALEAGIMVVTLLLVK